MILKNLEYDRFIEVFFDTEESLKETILKSYNDFGISKDQLKRTKNLFENSFVFGFFSKEHSIDFLHYSKGIIGWNRIDEVGFKAMNLNEIFSFSNRIWEEMDYEAWKTNIMEEYKKVYNQTIRVVTDWNEGKERSWCSAFEEIIEPLLTEDVFYELTIDGSNHKLLIYHNNSDFSNLNDILKNAELNKSSFWDWF